LNKTAPPAPNGSSLQEGRLGQTGFPGWGKSERGNREPPAGQNGETHKHFPHLIGTKGGLELNHRSVYDLKGMDPEPCMGAIGKGRDLAEGQIEKLITLDP